MVIITQMLIKTIFADTAFCSISETDTDGPYASFNHAVGKVTAGAYDGPASKLGGGPDTVARKIEKALTARRPRTRYKVTPSAGIVMTQRKIFSDRMWDRFVKTQYPQPGP